MTQVPKIVIIGSSNTDMVVRVPRLPGPGESVLGGSFAMVAGGKGANQAVAAARLGAHVTFVARLGTDQFGDSAVKGFEAEGIDCRYIVRDPETPSGVALIGVDENRGENSIVVAPGANAKLTAEDVEAAADAIRGAQVVVCQLETTLEAVAKALEIARAAGCLTILNPAPAPTEPLPAAILKNVTLLTPNETEAVLLTGGAVADPVEAARFLRTRGVGSVAVTIGAAGVHLLTDTLDVQIAGRRVAKVIDTTAAGDCFTGALAVVMAEGQDLEAAARFANAAAALSVTRAGAQPSLPMRADVVQFMGQTNEKPL